MASGLIMMFEVTCLQATTSGCERTPSERNHIGHAHTYAFTWPMELFGLTYLVGKSKVKVNPLSQGPLAKWVYVFFTYVSSYRAIMTMLHICISHIYLT